MLKIGNLKISSKEEPKLISEISANHAGRISIAMKLVRLAAKNGSDLIKLQTYGPEGMTLNSNKPEFVIKDKKSLWYKRNLFDLYSEGKTPKEWHYKLFKEAKKYNVKCFTSIFDENDIEFLEKLKVPAYKIASFESTHYPLIEKVIRTKKPILISTGLNTLKENKELVNFLKKKNCKNFALLKCTSSYPALNKNLNLKTIEKMKNKFNCEIGFSDHTLGFTASTASIQHGASFIEKHICLDNKTGLDAKFSLKVSDLKLFKKELRNAYLSMGKESYGPTKDEKASLVFRRSIYCSKDIKKGEKFTKSNLKVIRPGYGLEPKYLIKILGRKSKTNIKFATRIKWKHVK
jgi:N-acetylneuraminate synthase